VRRGKKEEEKDKGARTDEVVRGVEGVEVEGAGEGVEGVVRGRGEEAEAEGAKGAIEGAAEEEGEVGEATTACPIKFLADVLLLGEIGIHDEARGEVVVVVEDEDGERGILCEEPSLFIVGERGGEEGEEAAPPSRVESRGMSTTTLFTVVVVGVGELASVARFSGFGVTGVEAPGGFPRVARFSGVAPGGNAAEGVGGLLGTVALLSGDGDVGFGVDGADTEFRVALFPDVVRLSGVSSTGGAFFFSFISTAELVSFPKRSISARSCLHLADSARGGRR